MDKLVNIVKNGDELSDVLKSLNQEQRSAVMESMASSLSTMLKLLSPSQRLRQPQQRPRKLPVTKIGYKELSTKISILLHRMQALLCINSNCSLY